MSLFSRLFLLAKHFTFYISLKHYFWASSTFISEKDLKGGGGRDDTGKRTAGRIRKMRPFRNIKTMDKIHIETLID